MDYHTYMKLLQRSLVVLTLMLLFTVVSLRSASAQTTAEEINRSIRLTIAPHLTITIPPISPFPSGFPTRNPSRFPSINPTGLVATIRASACSSILSSMKERAKTLAEAMERTVSKLNSLADTVNTYYTKTLVPAGKTIPEYDKMMTDMATKKSAIATLIATNKQAADGMSCGNGDLTTQIRTFSSNMQSLIDAVRQYTASVRTFIAAVRSVSTSSPSAMPTTVTSVTPTNTP